MAEDRTAQGPRGAAPATLEVHPVTFGKLVQRPQGPVVAGVEHAITSSAAGLPRDVTDLCRPDLLVPADANPLHTVEPWAQAAGGLFIVPVLRAGAAPSERLWSVVGRLRPYTERGVGQGGRPATLVTAWPLPGGLFARFASTLVPVLGQHLAVEPELGTSPSRERFARPHLVLPLEPPKALRIADVPPAALVMLDALRRGEPTRWTRATFADEAAFLTCLGILLRLIPLLGGRAEPRAMLSASSGLAIGADSFLVSYVQDEPASPNEPAKLPQAWQSALARSPDEAVEAVAERAARDVGDSRLVEPRADPSALLFGHAGAHEGRWAGDCLADAVHYYRDPGYVAPLRQVVQSLGSRVRAQQTAALPEPARAGFLAASRGAGREGLYRDADPPTQPADASGFARLHDRGMRPAPATPQAAEQVARIAGAFARFSSGVDLAPDEIEALLGEVHALSAPPHDPLMPSLVGHLDAHMPPEHGRWLVVLGAAFSPVLAQAAEPVTLADVGPLLELIFPVQSGRQPPSQRLSAVHAALLAMARRHVLAVEVLDDAEMTLLVDGRHGVDIAPNRIYHAVPAADARARQHVMDVMDRSLVLQAWRPGVRSFADVPMPQRSPAQQLAHYAFRWRNENFVARGAQMPARLVLDALMALLARAGRGEAPQTQVGMLSGLIPTLAAAGYIEALSRQIAVCEEDVRRSTRDAAALQFCAQMRALLEGPR